MKSDYYKCRKKRCKLLISAGERKTKTSCLGTEIICIEFFPFIIDTHVFSLLCLTVNKHKPWIETTYHGIVTENDDKVLLDPPLIALDKDAPLRYAGERGGLMLLLLLLLFLYYLSFT